MPQSPVFLEPRTYKARRILDALHLLPLLGVFLWSVPILWHSSDLAPVMISNASIYIFGVWLILIPCQFWLSFKLRKMPDNVMQTARVMSVDEAGG